MVPSVRDGFGRSVKCEKFFMLEEEYSHLWYSERFNFYSWSTYVKVLYFADRFWSANVDVTRNLVLLVHSAGFAAYTSYTRMGRNNVSPFLLVVELYQVLGKQVDSIRLVLHRHKYKSVYCCTSMKLYSKCATSMLVLTVQVRVKQASLQKRTLKSARRQRISNFLNRCNRRG